MPPNPIHGNQLTEVVKHCRQECFGEPEGPGARIKAQVDRWTGGLSVGVWVAGVALGLLAVTVTVLIFAFPRLVRSEIAEEFDRRLGKGATSLSVKPTPPLSPWAVAHAETKGVSP